MSSVRMTSIMKSEPGCSMVRLSASARGAEAAGFAAATPEDAVGVAVFCATTSVAATAAAAPVTAWRMKLRREEGSSIVLSFMQCLLQVLVRLVPIDRWPQ
jgi:hypothetical protein